MFKFGSIQSVVSNNNTDQKRYFWAHKITVNLICMRIIWLEIIEMIRKKSVTSCFFYRAEEYQVHLLYMNLHPVTVIRFCS